MRTRVKTSSNLNRFAKELQKSLSSRMRKATQMLRTEIVVNRLNKPRTGPFAIGNKRRKGKRGGTIAGRAVRASGPPNYPAVLSRVTGHLSRSIYAKVDEEQGRLIGRVGTNVFYGAIHEFGSQRRSKTGFGAPRAWLRPAFKDMHPEIFGAGGPLNGDEIAKIVLQSLEIAETK